MDDHSKLRQEAQRQVDLGEALDSLQGNRAFKKLIDGYFLREFPAECSTILVNPHYTVEQQENALQNLHAVSKFSQFLTKIQNDAEIGKDQLAELTAIEVQDNQE